MGVLESFSLKGKVALVTGGAGLYGRQLVEAVAEAGAVTITGSRTLEAQQALAEKLCASGLAVEAEQYDQAEEESMVALRDRIVERHGRVDVLVNNAVIRSMKSVDNREEFEVSMRVNATGVFRMCEHFAEPMKEQGLGSIINIGSIQGVIGPDLTLYEGLPGLWWFPDYYFHKGGMVNYTRYLASTLGRFGIRANVISPGGYFNSQPETFLKRYEARTFLGRMANDTDLKGAVVFLASDASAYITGANLMVDAGYTAK